MSTFKVPNNICDTLDSLTRRFWWNPNKQEGNFLAWRAWDKLCHPRHLNGLGFKKAKDINNALLTKLAWMIATKRDSLCMEILRAKYKISNNWLRTDPHKSASPIWRAIEQAKKVIVKGACYAIGDGTNINVWEDPWVPWIEGFNPTPRVVAYNHLPILVSHLINTDMHCWKSNLIQELFDSTSAQTILSMPIPVTPTPDKLI